MRLAVAILWFFTGAGAAYAGSAADDPANVSIQQSAPASHSGLVVGSYGRVGVGSNLVGGTGGPIAITSHPPRLLESSYAELDLGYGYHHDGSGATLVSHLTLAFGEKLFHFDGDFAADIALRNLFLEARNVGVDGLGVWAGSRMVRGDDIYLFDFWPLDEQNIVGGGVNLDFATLRLGLSVGVNRLDDAYQLQTILVPQDNFGAREVVYLDRQRTVVALRAEHHRPLFGALHLKTVAYAEAQALGAGNYRRADGRDELLPADQGWMVGCESSVYRPTAPDYLNVFLRYARGLAIYDELGVPFGLDQQKRAAPARELLFGTSANVGFGAKLGLLAGGYARYFVDADPNVYDRDDRWELAASLRPAWFVTRYLHLLAEVNTQFLRPNGLSPVTGHHDKPLAVQAGLLPAISLEPESLSRPELRLVLATTWVNSAARDLWAPEDPRHGRSVHYYLGVSVEWWFNSSRYPGRSS